MKKWIEVANELTLREQEPKAILMGRHLIELGMPPGKLMGKMLADAFEHQLDGEFNDLDGAIQWARSQLELK